jgi:hypothetical protein
MTDFDELRQTKAQCLDMPGDRYVAYMNECTYYHGKGIERGDVKSWSKNRQREKEEDERNYQESKKD